MGYCISVMKNTSQITDLHTDSRIFSVNGDDFRADVVKGASVRIHGIDANNVNGPQSFDRTYQLGDAAVYDCARAGSDLDSQW